MRTDRSAIRPAAIALFTTWLVHDMEEVFTLPATSRVISARLDIPRGEVSPAQATFAITLMGLLVAGACMRGVRTGGDSRFFRMVLAGLEAHVVTHVLASVVLRRYTAGLVTAPLVMLPGARAARAAVRREGRPLVIGDTFRGAALMFMAALTFHLIARATVPAPPAQTRPGSAHSSRCCGSAGNNTIPVTVPISVPAAGAAVVTADGSVGTGEHRVVDAPG